jgi:replicative DNA helicase
VIVWDPALTLVIATQPKMLSALWGKPGVEGRGVLARPLYALPKPAYTTGRTPEASATVLAAFETRVRALFEDVPLLALDEDDRAQPVTLTLDAAAETEFERYENELAEIRRRLGTSDDADDEAAYLGWLSKLAGQTARLAACLHAAVYWSSGVTTNTKIDRDTVAAAITLARYFHAHALAVFGLMGELVEQRHANSILAWLRSRTDDELEALTVREVHRSRKAGTTAEQVKSALGVLEAHGYLRLERRPPGRQGGRPTERVHVSPALREIHPAHPTELTKAQKERGSVSFVGGVGDLFESSALVHVDHACREGRRWLGRDNVWRCLACSPPAFQGEVLAERDQ